ncbi:MAG: error-prone DNA polymerase [Hyphomicrobiales bacterium]|nr:MAG: error-prone DNA polymerase [Hyphomicrobiales bacterium]
MTGGAAFAELVAATNFSFLSGASHAHEMVGQAAELGLAAIGIADRNTLAGVVRAHMAAKEAGIKLLVGARLVTTDGFEVVCYPQDRTAYGRLSRLLTLGNRRAPKGECHITLADILAHAEGQILIAIPPRMLSPAFKENLAALIAGTSTQDTSSSVVAFPARPSLGREPPPPRRKSPNVFLALTLAFDGREKQRLADLTELSARTGAALVATTDALFHHPTRKPLADILTCIREKCTIAQAGYRLAANAERHLKPPAEMARLFARIPEAVTRSLDIAARVTFSLDELRYEYPDEPVPPGRTPQDYLEEITLLHARERYPDGVPPKVANIIAKEFALIAELRYAEYFLTVYDLVRFARSKGILCQGRGAAANSAVCFCLGITSVDPTEIDLLFERFISAERGEPPDIDVDFEHERREEVIQYLYERYGRHRAAICATVIHYRPRMAIREVGKALGLTEDVTAALAGLVWGYGDGAFPEEHVREAGLDPDNPELRQALALANTLLGFPRHLSQHVGGFVLTRHRLDETVPILNAAMEDRTNIEWDKDDIDALGILKVDVLALGMLSAIRKSFDLIEKHYGWRPTLAMEPTDKRVYDMLSRADSIGVFQVESRAQMSMLPRLKPRCFYDLVIEVAIVRPGPIQGDMVHPYLRRRDGLEQVSYPSDALKAVLSKTLGVPLFQEQAMQIAIVGAGFTPGEADKLRRAMATFRHVGTIHTFRERFINGMIARGYDAEFAERCFSQIEGFGEYGFPESHAASFALLVYVSAWIKYYFPEVFCAALINSQPMGFYQPAQLVRDAKEHRVAVLPPDINASDWDCTLEPGAHQPGRPTTSAPSGNACLPRSPETGSTETRVSGLQTADAQIQRVPPEHARLAVRLGLRLISGLQEAATKETVLAQRRDGYTDIPSLWLRSQAPAALLERLADADAFRSLGLDRRQALWAVKGLEGGALKAGHKRSGRARAPIFAQDQTGDLFAEARVALPETTLGEHVVEDYSALGLSLKAHPVSFFRERLKTMGVISSAEHWEPQRAGRRAKVAGLVLVRQRPGTAKGVIFLTMEDETGVVNVVVWPKMFEKFRRIVMSAQFLLVRGRIERHGLVSHVIAEDLVDLSRELATLSSGRPLHHEGREVQEGSWRPKSRDFH